MMRETETVPDDEDDEARRSQTLLERPQRSHEESTNKRPSVQLPIVSRSF